MGKNKKNDELWKEVYQRCHFSVRHIQMAKELGLNPKSLIKNIPNPKEKWKLPVRDWIEEMYAKRFKRRQRILCSRSANNQGRRVPMDDFKKGLGDS